jgi:hypothetical protein
MNHPETMIFYIIPYEPFLLRENNRNEPTVFDMTFGDQNNTSRYTFSTTASEIAEEAMFDLSTSRERTIFVRSKGQNSTAAKDGFGKKILKQLVPTRTHDVGLMKSSGGQGVLDDKDIVYVEKDMFEQSIATPHGKKRTARKDDNIEKKYRFGVYGGKPIVL